MSLSSGRVGWQAFDLRWSADTAQGQTAQNPPDAYVEWAELTGYQGMVPVADSPTDGQAGESGDSWVEVLVELKQPLSEDDLRNGTLPFDAPPLYALRASLPRVAHTKAMTARVKKADLGTLWRHPAIARFELGLAVQGQVASRENLMIDVMDVTKVRVQQGPLMAVIDHGCPFLHEQFLGDPASTPAAAQSTRIQWLWDQGSDAQPAPWQLNTTAGYGRLLDKAAIDGLLQQRAAAAASQGWVEDELQTYASLQHLQRPPPHEDTVYERTHGAHVLDVAAGRRDTWGEPYDPNDHAARAPILFVQLPSETVYDSSGGSLGVRILDALHFVLAQTQGPVVVNISYGTHAGPHDGSSLLEAAIDELCTVEDRLTVVIAAGNSRLARAHAQVAMTPGSPPALLLARAPAADRNDSFIELWYPNTPGVGVALRIVSPEGQASPWCGAGHHLQLLDATGRVRAALIHLARTAGATDASMALLAMVNRPDGPTAAGDWTIECRLPAGSASSVEPVEIHAWIERDDLARGEPGDPLVFVPEACVPDTAVTETHTLASIATGRKTVVVGASESGFRPADYASLGPTRDGRDLPNVLGLCADDDAMRSIRAAACRSGDSFRMSGSSVAAAVISRLIFNAA